MSIDVGENKWPYRVKEPKDPAAVLDYQLDWSAWLGATETLSAVVWRVDNPSSEVTVTAQSFTAATTTVWLSGGTVSADTQNPTLAHVTCRITTNSVPIQRVDERTLILTIKDR